MSQLFGGATAKALQATLENIANDQNQSKVGDKFFYEELGKWASPYDVTSTTQLNLQNAGTSGTVTFGGTTLQPGESALMQAAGGTYSNTLSTASAAQNRISRSLEASLKQQYAAMLQNAPMATRAAWLNGKWDEAPPVAKKERACTCGGKFAGGTHSHWCDIHE